MAHSKRVKIETKRDKKEELSCSRVVYCSRVKGNEKKDGNRNSMSQLTSKYFLKSILTFLSNFVQWLWSTLIQAELNNLVDKFNNWHIRMDHKSGSSNWCFS